MAWVCPSCGELQDDEGCLKCTCGYTNLPTSNFIFPPSPVTTKDAQMKYSGFWKRTASIFIDMMVLLPFFFLQNWLDSLSKTVALILAVLFPVLFCAYDVCFVAMRGQTPGKMAVGIKIVKVNGGPVSWKEAFLRHSINIIFATAGVIAICIAITKIPASEYAGLSWESRTHRLYELRPSGFRWMDVLSNIWIWSEVIVLLFNKKKRALHDFIAGTVVIRAKKDDVAAANYGVDSDATNTAAQVTP